MAIGVCQNQYALFAGPTHLIIQLPPAGRFLKKLRKNVPVIKALIFSPAGAEDKRLDK